MQSNKQFNKQFNRQLNRQYNTTNVLQMVITIDEKCIKYDDVNLAIKWPKLTTEYIISNKDLLGLNFNDIK